MSTSDPRTRRNEDDDRHQGYSATGNAEGEDVAGTTEPTVSGGGDHPAVDHIAAAGLPGRTGPYDVDPDPDGRGYSATGNAAGAGRAGRGTTERTVTGGGAHPAANHIVADGLPGRADPPDGGFRDDVRNDGPTDPDGLQGPRSEERTR